MIERDDMGVGRVFRRQTAVQELDRFEVLAG